MKTCTWLALLAPLCLAAVTASACPEINGVFESKSGSLTRTVQLYTQRDGRTYSYKLGADAGFVPADGAAHALETESGRSGKVTVSCDETSVTVSGQEGGASAVTLKVTAVDADHVRVSSDLTAANGVYARAR